MTPAPLTITLYTTKTCPYCRQEKAWLDGLDIAYTNHSVDDDLAKQQEMIASSGQMGVPVTVVTRGSRQEVVIGFDQPKLAELLQINK